MRILHISQTGLPDLRIEKTALTMKNEGNELIFLGGRPFKWQNLDAFSRVLYQPVGNNLEIALSPLIKQKWLKTIEKINPDVIHAHNVWVARFLLGTDYSVIYDDHEYWSKQMKHLSVKSKKTRLTYQPAMMLVPSWERKLLEKYPTLTTTENTAIEHRRICKWVGVTRNVPTLMQIEGLTSCKDRNGLVYTGSDFASPEFLPYRNMTGLRNLLDFNIVTGLTHRGMMEALTKYEIGLTPWLPHPWHPYSDANRNYEYLHAGLQVVVNSIIKSLFPNNPFVHAFKDYSDIMYTIESIRMENPEVIMEYANKHYIWENQIPTIKDAYSKA